MTDLIGVEAGIVGLRGLDWRPLVAIATPARDRPRAKTSRARTREEHQQWCDFACTTRIFGDRGVKCLFVLAEEVVVGSVRHELLITHIGGGGATISGGRSPFGV